jgi:NAD(P)-dependent dehydrogenase (short-subunit alcohol dehydrogenase family)
MSTRVAVVAGAGGPLGHATSLSLAGGGFTVVGVDRTQLAPGELPDEIRTEIADTTDRRWRARSWTESPARSDRCARTASG